MNKKNFALYLGFILIIALAFFLRLYSLNERVFHHDEAAVGYFTYKLFNDGVYSYDPSFHGPFMYYAAAGMFRLFGDSDYSARLLPALLGAAMLFLLIPLRRHIGNAGMIFAAFFLALSPSFLYYSRFYREDIFIAFFTLLGIVCVVKYAENRVEERQLVTKVFYLLLGAVVFLSMIALQVVLPGSTTKHVYVIITKAVILLVLFLLILLCGIHYSEKYINYNYSILRVFYLFLGAIALASMAALKENAYIAMGLIALFLLLLFIRERWYKDLIGKIKRCEKRLMITVAEGAFFILVLLVAFSLFYTGKPLDIHGMYAAVEKAVSHWYEMHRMQRIGGPLYFYLPMLALYELPVLVFGLLGIIHYYKKNSLFMIFIGYWAITNLIIYSYLQEKVPWLILNPLLPLAIIAAGYIGEILPRLKFNSIVGAATIIFLVISSSYFVYSSVLLNYYNYTNPAEPLIQAAQPPQKFSLFLDKINEISLQYQNKSTELQLTDVEMETQFLWYMRHFSNIKWRVSIDSELTAPLIVVHDTDGNESKADIVKRHLRTDYERLDSAKMSWYWFKPSDVTLDYLLYRKMDRKPGEYRVVLFYKPKY